MATARSEIIGDYLVGETLGTGAYGTVKFGTHRFSGETVALKIMDVSNRPSLTEVEAMTLLHHPNILQIKDALWDVEYRELNGNTTHVLLIVLELANGGELFDFLCYTGAFDEIVARTYFHQLISGLKECHSRNITHRDLKPENLLLDKNFQLKISDFGLSHIGNDIMQTRCGSYSYMAPEVLAGREYNHEVDVFSCGVILFIMLSGSIPFGSATLHDENFRKLVCEEYGKFWGSHLYAYFPDTAKDLLNKMLAEDPAKRISLDGIEQHEWFKGPTLTIDELKIELDARKQIVDTKKMRRKSEAARKIQVVSIEGRTAYRGTMKYRDQDSHVMPEKLNEGKGNEKCEKFPPTMYGPEVGICAYTNFETYKDPREVMRSLRDLLLEIDCSYQESLWSLECNYITCVSSRQESDGSVVDIRDLSVPFVREIRFSIRLWQHPMVENRVIVVFRRLEGRYLLFQELFKDLLHILNGWGFVSE